MQLSGHLSTWIAVKNDTQKPAKPLEGTPLLRRPGLAGYDGWKAIYSDAFPSCPLLPGWHRQSQAGQSPSAAPRGPASPASHLFELPCPTGSSISCTWATRAICQSPNPLTPPTPTQPGATAGMCTPPQLVCPWWIPCNPKTTHPTRPSPIKKQLGYTICSLTGVQVKTWNL